jgi:hypothetical protein
MDTQKGFARSETSVFAWQRKKTSASCFAGFADLNSSCFTPDQPDYMCPLCQAPMRILSIAKLVEDSPTEFHICKHLKKASLLSKSNIDKGLYERHHPWSAFIKRVYFADSLKCGRC